MENKANKNGTVKVAVKNLTAGMWIEGRDAIMGSHIFEVDRVLTRCKIETVVKFRGDTV